MDIAIDTNGLVYEGANFFGQPIWPTPVVTGAKIVSASSTILEAERSGETFGLRFREDSFDPVSRIRRGRLYKAADTQQSPWTVRIHPALPAELINNPTGLLRKPLGTFCSHSIYSEIKFVPSDQPILLLGFDDRFTVWTIISVERMSIGEELITLKHRQSLGVLPVISAGQLPENYKAGLLEKLDRLTDNIYRAGPESVIDRSRDVASLSTIAFFRADGTEARELAEMAGKLERESRKFLAANCARIIALLHSRTKPTEQMRRDFRPLREQDAELAVLCTGTLLCEFGWAEWR
jgi:hypothetical protein